MGYSNQNNPDKLITQEDVDRYIEIAKKQMLEKQNENHLLQQDDEQSKLTAQNDEQSKLITQNDIDQWMSDLTYEKALNKDEQTMKLGDLVSIAKTVETLHEEPIQLESQEPNIDSDKKIGIMSEEDIVELIGELEQLKKIEQVNQILEFKKQNSILYMDPDVIMNTKETAVRIKQAEDYKIYEKIFVLPLLEAAKRFYSQKYKTYYLPNVYKKLSIAEKQQMIKYDLLKNGFPENQLQELCTYIPKNIAETQILYIANKNGFQLEFKGEDHLSHTERLCKAIYYMFRMHKQDLIKQHLPQVMGYEKFYDTRYNEPTIDERKKSI